MNVNWRKKKQLNVFMVRFFAIKSFLQDVFLNSQARCEVQCIEKVMFEKENWDAEKLFSLDLVNFYYDKLVINEANVEHFKVSFFSFSRTWVFQFFLLFFYVFISALIIFNFVMRRHISLQITESSLIIDDRLETRFFLLSPKKIYFFHHIGTEKLNFPLI
jgi:hypothetical protein